MDKKKALSKELVSLVKLVSFFKQLRHKDTLDKAGFFFVNDLFNITPYKQCVFWTYEYGKIKLRTASGQTDVSDQSPHAQLFKKAITVLIDKKLPKGPDSIERNIDAVGYASVVSLSAGDMNDIALEMGTNISPNSICIFLYDANSLIGGVWIDKEKPIGEMEKAVLEDVGDALSSQVQFFRQKQKSPFKSLLKTSRSKKIACLILLVFCLWPVRFSVTATAEVVAEDQEAVSVTYNALIDKVLVKPNQEVSEGDVLFTLDKTQLDNEYALAKQELNTSKERLAKTERESFSDPEKKFDINVLRGVVQSKLLEVDYAKERLSLSDIVAPKNGVVLFSDPNDLIGQPVGAGDQVMVVANPQKIELLVRIPAESMIDLDYSAPIKFFLNTSPLESREGIVNNISYQAVRTPDGLLVYNARAEITDKAAIERIGLTGTAKLYGGRTVMIFNLLRRPFIGLRNLLAF